MSEVCSGEQTFVQLRMGLKHITHSLKPNLLSELPGLTEEVLDSGVSAIFGLLAGLAENWTEGLVLFTRIKSSGKIGQQYSCGCCRFAQILHNISIKSDTL